MLNILRWTIFILISMLLSCAQQSSQGLFDDQNQSTSTNPAPFNPDLKICSKLDIEGIQWPTNLSSTLTADQQRVAFALALNITSSFEGSKSSWQTISDNFDGQGMSLGLMNQNFGQGSLQPLIISLFKKDNSTLLSSFATADYNSLKNMLISWNGSTFSTSSIQSKAQSFVSEDEFAREDSLTEEDLFPAPEVLHEYERAYERRQEKQFSGLHSKTITASAISSKNQPSVSWAVQNLYDNKGAFITRWKTSFQKMASSASYRTLQVEAATKMFTKAIGYFNTFKFKEMRSLLMMFDTVVQSGGFGTDAKDLFEAWDKKNPSADEKTRALALIEIRISVMDSQKYADDVRSRRQTIIYGAGTVHGSKRNLPTEYCFDHTMSVQ